MRRISSMEKVAILGLGIMGRGIAVNLIKTGYQVTVWNRTRSKTKELSDLGAVAADTPRQAADGCDVVILMLADPPAVTQTAFGPDGVVEGLKGGAVLVDCSTVDPWTSKKLAQAASGKGAGFLDCPVTGSKAAAESGELVLMAGGDTQALDKARPVLESISKKIIHAGGTGMGSQLKLCFNLMVSHMAASLAESLVMAAKAGLDPEIVLEAIGMGTIASKFYDWKGNLILDRDFTTNFALKLMHKDLNLIMTTAYELNMPLPVTAAVKELFSTAKASGNPDEDFSSVVKALEIPSGVEVKRQSSPEE